MIKLWKIFSISIVLAVCLGLVLVPAMVVADPGANDCWLEIDPALTEVGFDEAFEVNVTFHNPVQTDLKGMMCHINFTASLVEVISIDYGLDPFNFTIIAPVWNNTEGWLDYDGSCPLGAGITTNVSSGVFLTIHMKSRSGSGIAALEFVPVDEYLDLETAIKDEGLGDHLNWSMVVNGTVTVSGMPVLTVAVVGSGNVTINGTLPPSYPNTTIRTPGDNVTLEAIPAGGWEFHNWTGVSGPTGVNLSYVIMVGNKNVTAHFTPKLPELNVTPSSLPVPVLPNGTANASYTITNTGGGYLNWNSSNVTYGTATGWLNQDITDGNLTYNMSDTVNVTANATGLAKGTYNATINITGNSSALVNVTLFVGTPEISVIPTSLPFTTTEGENPADKTLEVWNSGTGMLDWTMTDDKAWLDESPTTGNSTGVGDKTSVNVSVDVSGMKAGDYSATITITDPLANNTPQTVSVSLAIAAAAEVEVPEEEELPEIILGPASVSASGLSISPQQVEPGQDVTISISVANTGGKTGSYNAVLYINGAVEDSQSVSVAAGASKNVIFTVSKSKAGVYDVSLAGQSGQFEVVSTGWFGGGLGTGGIIAIVVVVIVLIVAVIFILRGTARPE